jgi:hypothetical protein
MDARTHSTRSLVWLEVLDVFMADPGYFTRITRGREVP